MKAERLLTGTVVTAPGWHQRGLISVPRTCLSLAGLRESCGERAALAAGERGEKITVKCPLEWVIDRRSYAQSVLIQPL